MLLQLSHRSLFSSYLSSTLPAMFKTFHDWHGLHPLSPKGECERATKFSKSRGLTGRQFLEGDCLKREDDLSQGGCNFYFYTKNKQKSEIFNPIFRGGHEKPIGGCLKKGVFDSLQI